MMRTAPDRAIVKIAHVTFDGQHEWLEFRCTVKAVRQETAVIWRDSKFYCEEVALEQLVPRPDPVYWGTRDADNNSYIIAQNPAQNEI